MAHAWANITYMSDEDFKMELARRKTPESKPAQAAER
jgi:hypothetical protein